MHPNSNGSDSPGYSVSVAHLGASRVSLTTHVFRFVAVCKASAVRYPQRIGLFGLFHFKNNCSDSVATEPNPTSVKQHLAIPTRTAFTFPVIGLVSVGKTLKLSFGFSAYLSQSRVDSAHTATNQFDSIKWPQTEASGFKV